MAQQDLVIGIDVGGQTAKCGVVDARGNIIAQTVISTEDDTTASVDALPTLTEPPSTV